MTTSAFSQLILDSLHTAIVLLDAKLKILYLNPAAEELLIMSGHQIEGNVFTDIFTAAEELTEILQQCLLTQHPVTKREGVFTLLDQRRIKADYTVNPIYTAESLLLLIEVQPLDRLLGISKDDALLAKHQATQTLLRGMAHEIKNPLGGIRGAAQLLAKELPSNNDLHDYTQVIIQEADRLRNLVDRMLGPQRAPKLAAVNIHEILERVRNLILAEANHYDLSIQRDYDPSLPELWIDQEQIIQAILNVVRNAMEALTGTGGPSKGIIILKTRPLHQYSIGAAKHRLVIQIDVIDNGPGIPEHLRDHIFYPMVSGRPNGTGLGLSISQSIFNQYQGLIECDSRPGHTLFKLLLPMLQP